MQSPLNTLDYLQSQSEVLKRGDYWNCLKAARAIAELLVSEGKQPWIARFRQVERRGEHDFHVPLLPLGLARGRSWTSHYVCCCAEVAYEPVLGKITQLQSYCLEVFGRDIPMEVFVSTDGIQDYLAQSH